jgi:hypothetical protein
MEEILHAAEAGVDRSLAWDAWSANHKERAFPVNLTACLPISKYPMTFSSPLVPAPIHRCTSPDVPVPTANRKPFLIFCVPMSKPSYVRGPETPLVEMTLAEALARTAQRYPGRPNFFVTFPTLRSMYAETSKYAEARLA